MILLHCMNMACTTKLNCLRYHNFEPTSQTQTVCTFLDSHVIVTLDG